MNKEIQQEWMEFDTDGLDYFGGRQEGHLPNYISRCERW